MKDLKQLEEISKLVRYYIITSTTKAGSGHPTSSLSAVELMVALMFGRVLRYKIGNPNFCNNDRLIFSKGHASPLLYALWAVAGKITEKELMNLRNFDSTLEGHPTKRFEHAEAATGSLGQGLSIGMGMALNAKYLDMLPYRTYVLLGDSEMAEGSAWEAIQLSNHYKLHNLIGVIDANGLGQTGWTMYRKNTRQYYKRISSFGWEAIEVDGHNLEEILQAYQAALNSKEKPVMIIAKTVKGKGVRYLEDKQGFHGKPIPEDKLDNALKDIGEVNKGLKGQILEPENLKPHINMEMEAKKIALPKGKYATRKAYGNGLVEAFSRFPEIVALDGEVSNSTYAEIFKENYPNNFFEMYIAEQNMVGAALGLSLRGKIPFVSSFAAFLTRAFDQIRMTQYSDTNIKFVGSHAGVSIGADGPSQMGLEDIAMFRTLIGGVVLYPSDAISTIKLIKKVASYKGNVYIRTTRMDLPTLYNFTDDFEIGGSKTLKHSPEDRITVCAAGITLHETLKAYEILKEENIYLRVIDLYSIKPVDYATLLKAKRETRAIITVEDHYAEGGLGEAVCNALSQENIPVYLMAVGKTPRSGEPEELLEYENISSEAIVKKAREIIEGG
ncbi:MAG: transketolase [Actinomycetota bacterium]